MVTVLSAAISYGDCPCICPDCRIWLYSLERNELGAINKICVEAECDLLPWCFELEGKGTLQNVSGWVPITEEYMDFLTSKSVTASVRDGRGYFCVAGPFQISIPLPGIGTLAGQGSVINFTIGSVKFSSCLGECPCWRRGISPWPELTLKEKHVHHRVTIHMRVSDPDCDLVCTGYGGQLRGEFVIPEVPMLTVGTGLLCTCDEDQVYELHTCDPDTIWAWARDAKGNKKDSWPPIKLTANMPPNISISQKEVQARLGEIMRITISATDPDDDSVAISKVSGPGELKVYGQPEVHENLNKASANGTWSWKAKGYNPWQLVFFEATDQCGASSRAYLLIHILQPPQPYSGSAWVNRGATERTSLYVHDPDSFSHDFTFSPPLGISVQVVSQHELRDEDGGWGGLLYEVDVSVDRALCPGTYSVPFTVTDPDGNSGQATLTVHVLGNRPPEVRGKLYGEATVVLYPDRVEVSPVVVRGEVFDPEGDQVFVEAPGIPPQFAANLSAFLEQLGKGYVLH